MFTLNPGSSCRATAWDLLDRSLAEVEATLASSVSQAGQRFRGQQNVLVQWVDLRENLEENHRFSYEIWDFPVICPFNQLIGFGWRPKNHGGNLEFDIAVLNHGALCQSKTWAYFVFRPRENPNDPW